MRPKVAWIIFFIVLTASLGIGIKKLKERKAEISNLTPPKVYPLPVEAVRVKEGTLTEEYTYIGKVEPYSYATISTIVGGKIIKVSKREGDSFKKGEVLAKIDNSQIITQINSLKEKIKSLRLKKEEIKAQLDAAKTVLKNAEKELKREKFLYSKGAVPHTAVEKAENQYSTARAKVESLKLEDKVISKEIKSLSHQVASLSSKLPYTILRAVKDGVVTELLSHEGDTALPGKPIMRVVYPKDGMKVLLTIPEKLAQGVKIGAKAKFTEGEGVITKLYPEAEKRTGLYVLEIKVTKGNLKPKENVITTIPVRRATGLIVPQSAILHLKDGKYLLKIAKGEVIPIKVSVLLESQGKAVVKGNLKANDTVAVGRESKLLEVMRIRKVVPEVNNEQNS